MKSNNSSYCINNISKNISRDDKIDRELYTLGWTVVHICGKDILNHTYKCIQYIEELIYEKNIDKNYTDDFDCDYYFDD